MKDTECAKLIRANTRKPALYEQAAEEAVELAHAAMKAARVLRGESPTPVKKEAALERVTEELSDLVAVLLVLRADPDPEKVYCKLNRWVDRIKEGEYIPLPPLKTPVFSKDSPKGI